ncbi:unnamed protein product [Medioppia subpectinata]|uniref:Uncharacterized protein n=1 Tax=Medioppia subpectinata TaxID=1979941 RepID=A0A7R9L3M3_9ACAR|nr:unnamed protein product [Medioppia subpectinata]CAG2113761.1 unnamed protein product [Medioppia subpectinata]
MSNDYASPAQRKYSVPEGVVSILSYERNPQHGIQPLTARAQQWQQFKRISGTTEFTDYFWPFCTDPDRYEILIKLILNLFVLDDHMETPYGDIDRRMPEAETIFGQLYRVYDKLLQPTDRADQPEYVSFHAWKPYVLGAYAIYDKVFTAYNDVQKHRFIDIWRSWTDGMVGECAHLQHNKQFDNLDEFFEVREKSVAILMIYHLIEYAENLFVPELEWRNPTVQQLLKQLSQANGRGDKGPSAVYNSVAVLTQMQNISLTESMTHWSNEFKNLETIIVELSDEILAADWASPDIRRFVRSAMYATGGHWKVSTMLDRIASYDNVVTLPSTTSNPCHVDNTCNCTVDEIEVICGDEITDTSIKRTFNEIKMKKYLDAFELYDNHLITGLPDYIFYDVSFKTMNVFNVKTLTMVGENAFASSVNTTTSLRISSCSLKSSESLFKAISQLVRLTSVNLSDNQLEEIPDNAFGPNQHLLTMVILDRNRLKILADNSFTLQSVNGSQYNPLRISLKLNQIAQIGDQAFAGLDRPVTLDLSFNNLTQLTAKTFAHLLSYEPSKIIVKGNHVNCICGLKWVYVNSTMKPKMSGPLRCDDKRYFSSLTDTDFKNCT